MYKVKRYLASDSMSELICDNYPMLLVMSRFGIDLGFGEESIGEVCSRSGVETETFLAVVNMLVARDKSGLKIDYSKISMPTLIKYLHNSHKYFLEYRLPSIRRTLIEALANNDDVSVVIVNYYNEYFTEVYNHMNYEEGTLFPYITSVIEGSGETRTKYSIDTFSKHHDKVESKLSELKSILIKYYPAKTTNELNNALYEIFSCERDLASHNDIEDYLLVPTMKMYESLTRGEDHV